MITCEIFVSKEKYKHLWFCSNKFVIIQFIKAVFPIEGRLAITIKLLLLTLSKIESKSKKPVFNYVLSGEYYNDNGESLGCGGDPEVGKEYAIRHIDKISEIVGKPDVVFLVVSFGGGCGTGATPVIAEMLNELGVKTIAIIGKPFHWEGEMRKQRTIDGIEKLKQYVKKSIIIDYQSLTKTFPPNTSFNAGWNYIYEKVAEEFYKAINCLY